MSNFGKFFLLTTLYFMTGKLGLLLAVPPGYATAVWPPSGFALAGILVFGNRYWPSIWLGSFLVNISLSLDPSNLATIFGTSRPAFIIGLGAALQAVVGASLIRAVLGYPLALVKENDVFKFLFLAGPLSCLTNATWGILTLVGTGAIKPESIYFSWWTWWVGDTIGVLIFAPIFMIFVAEPKDIWRSRKMSVALPMLSTFALLVALFIFMRNSEENRIKSDFNAQAHLMESAITNHMHEYLNVLYSIQSFYKSSQSVERSEFSSFVTGILARHAGITALEWNPKVTADQRDHFVESIRREGFSGFEIKAINAQGQLEKSLGKDLYFPITFVEPWPSNKKIVGFDLLSEKTRQVVMQRAWHSGEIKLTKPVTLLQGPKGAIAILAIYSNGPVGDDSGGRLNALKGFTVEILRVQSIVGEALESFKKKDFILQIDDIDLQDGSQNVVTLKLLDDTEELGMIRKGNRGLVWEKNEEFGGRNWRIRLYPTADYFIAQESWNMWLVLAAGLLFVGFLGGFLIIISRREIVIRQLVDEQTQGLNQANVQLRQEMEKHEKLARSLESRNKELDEARLVALNIAQDEQEARKRAQEVEKQLMAAMNVKSEFTSMVSHELRTPLTVIKESVAIVYDETAGPVNPDQKDFLETAKRNVDRLARLINDVLDYQKLEGQHMEFRMVEQDINDVVKEAGESFSLSLKNKNLVLKFQFQEDLPRLFFDKDRITQVLTNLLSNAMKFAVKGTITLITETGGDNSIKVSVKDEGIGIKESDLSKLFQSFSQISTGMERQTGGTGLGLALCKKIIEQHGGKISVESVYGQGTAFYFFLPVKDRRGGR